MKHKYITPVIERRVCDDPLMIVVDSYPIDISEAESKRFIFVPISYDELEEYVRMEREGESMVSQKSWDYCLWEEQ